MSTRIPLSGIVLAGGRALRMGGVDKGLIEVAGRPLIAHVLARLRPQVGDIVINANRHAAIYAQFSTPVVADADASFAGPLAGIAAALPHCRQEWALVVACDCPLLPENLGATLSAALAPGALLAMAHDGERAQPLCLLLHRSLQQSLVAALQAGHNKVESWCLEQPHVVVPFADTEIFRNINTEAERLALEQELQAAP
jgi:molybdopterin-guanine dinucleotide biosynthesis protein A